MGNNDLVVDGQEVATDKGTDIKGLQLWITSSQIVPPFTRPGPFIGLKFKILPGFPFFSKYSKSTTRTGPSGAGRSEDISSISFSQGFTQLSNPKISGK